MPADDDALGIDNDGLGNPNCLIDATTASTAAPFWQGLPGQGLLSESFRNSILIGGTMSTGYCAGGSELRSAAPAIQGGEQADQRNRPSLNKS
jgi:hypothetical protein